MKEPLQLLIVDDEMLEIEYLLTLLHKSRFGFANVSVAFSKKMAQGILKSQLIDLMLCDIEMPQGSGLELLRWAREEGIDVATIIITCHPEFTYAQEAVKLSSVDYLLKPISLPELDQSLGRAVAALERNKAASHYLRHAEKVRDALFQDFMQDSTPLRELQIQMGELGLDYQPEESMVPLFFRVDFSRRRAVGEGDYARKTILVNVVQDVLFDFQAAPWFYFPSKTAFFTAFRQSELPEPLDSFSKGRLSRLLRNCRELLQLPMACFIGGAVPFWQLPRCCQDMQEHSQRVFACSGIICPPMGGPAPSRGLENTKAEEWKLILHHGGPARLQEELAPYLQDLRQRGVVPASEVWHFSQMLAQAALRFSEEMAIPADTVLTESQQQELQMRHGLFLEEFPAHVEQLLGRLEDALGKLDDGQLVKRVAAYIESHLEEDLDRGSLAKRFGISPEHLSRLFHRDMDVSLVAYITNAKLEYCRRMFDTTDCSVHEAAERVGYTNFSYFTKLFRKAYGCTPQEYRRHGHSD